MARDRRSTNRFRMAERQGYDYSLLFIVLIQLAYGQVLLFSPSSYLGAVEHSGDSAY